MFNSRRCIDTARSRRLPPGATSLVSEWCTCSVNIGISVTLPVYVPQERPTRFFGISGRVSCVFQYKTVVIWCKSPVNIAKTTP